MNEGRSMSVPFFLQLEADTDSYFTIIRWKWEKNLYASNAKNIEKVKRASEML